MWLLPVLAMSFATTQAASHFDPAVVPSATNQFLQANCLDCHNGDNAEAGFDLGELKQSVSSENFDRWVEVYDRVASGEMPPAEMPEPSRSEVDQFVASTKAILHDQQQQEFDQLGRVQGRRLSHLQLERSLHDTLGIDIPLQTLMPEEQRTAGFTSIADGQSISQHQLQTHLKVVDAALDEAFRRAITKEDEWSRPLTARDLARRRANRRCREPEMLDGEAVVWSGGITFYGRLPVTTAAESGWYRLTIKARGLNVPKDSGIWCTVRTGLCISSAPMLATVDTFRLSEEPQEYSFVAWVPKGHMFEIRPGDKTLKQGRFAGGQIGAGEGTPQNLPGLAMQSAILERVHMGPVGQVVPDDGVRGRLFGDLPVDNVGRPEKFSVQSKAPKSDITRLMHVFAERAFRRPVDENVVQPFADFALQQLEAGTPFHEALKSGYRAVLCSPRFLYFQESPGALDDYAIASRLSYMLWNRPPGDELLKLAAAGKLQNPEQRRLAAERMLQDSRADHFVPDLADQWLQLSEIDFTEPDRRMFKDFDIVVQEAMVAETHEFLRKMLQDDLSVTHLIDSDFTYLNSRLARYYGMDEQLQDGLHLVKFDEKNPRGGLMTHGSILKVTANGTSTSPVVRGVWMAERLLGIHIPAPPENVPAIEPDIRGATSIRDMLEKHKSDSSCASCHIKIDPAGFALENFDPAGRYRAFYPTAKRRSKGIPIDSSSKTPDGRPFQDLQEFQRLMVEDRFALAQNVARHLVAFGTGALCQFADRDDIDAISRQSEPHDFGFRTLVLNTVASDLFATK